VLLLLTFVDKGLVSVKLFLNLATVLFIQLDYSFYVIIGCRSLHHILPISLGIYGSLKCLELNQVDFRFKNSL